MTTSAQAWPFAITRAMRTDYRLVAAPDFLLHSGQAADLSAAANGNVDPDCVYLRPCSSPDGTELWCAYRSVPLLAADVDRPGDTALDEFGRPIRLIEGIVCQQRPDAVLGQGLFHHVHPSLVPTLTRFYAEDSATFRAVPTLRFFLSDVSAGEPMRLREQARLQLRKGGLPAPSGRFPDPIAVRAPVPTGHGSSQPGGRTGEAATSGQQGSHSSDHALLERIHHAVAGRGHMSPFSSRCSED